MNRSKDHPSSCFLKKTAKLSHSALMCKTVITVPLRTRPLKIVEDLLPSAPISCSNPSNIIKMKHFTNTFLDFPFLLIFF